MLKVAINSELYLLSENDYIFLEQKMSYIKNCTKQFFDLLKHPLLTSYLSFLQFQGNLKKVTPMF